MDSMATTRFVHALFTATTKRVTSLNTTPGGVIEWLIIVKEQLLSEGLTFANLFFVVKMCFVLSRRMEIVTFLRKNADLPKLVVDFLGEKIHSGKNMEIVKDFG